MKPTDKVKSLVQAAHAKWYKKQLKKGNKLIKENSNKVAITKGCPNSGEQCFCTGECREVIGYREKHPLEK